MTAAEILALIQMLVSMLPMIPSLITEIEALIKEFEALFSTPTPGVSAVMVSVKAKLAAMPHP